MAVLGITVPDEDILRILTGLNFQPEINGDELTMHFPAYREDMADYPDVAEESHPYVWLRAYPVHIHADRSGNDRWKLIYGRKRF